jgi:hypothetical protein
MAGTTDFTYTHATFARRAMTIQVALDYISSNTANGTDDQGNAITGYKWWNFAYPTALNSGSNNAAVGRLHLRHRRLGELWRRGGFRAFLRAKASRFGTIPANPGGWAASATILLPSTLPLGFVQSQLNNNSFTMTVLGGTSAATIACRRLPAARPWYIKSIAPTASSRSAPSTSRPATGLTTLTNLAVGCTGEGVRRYRRRTVR